jgi:hypothetical protein
MPALRRSPRLARKRLLVLGSRVLDILAKHKTYQGCAQEYQNLYHSAIAKMVTARQEKNRIVPGTSQYYHDANKREDLRIQQEHFRSQAVKLRKAYEECAMFLNLTKYPVIKLVFEMNRLLHLRGTSITAEERRWTYDICDQVDEVLDNEDDESDTDED